MDQIPIWLRTFAAAEIGECPSRITNHGHLSSIVEKVKQRRKRTASQHVVAHIWTVASNITEGPDGLFANIGFRTAEEFDKERNRVTFDNFGSL